MSETGSTPPATLEATASPEPLFQRAVKGGVWVFGLRAISELLVMTRLIVLARLVPPEQFGLMGIALLTIEILDTFSQTGFQSALIQRKGAIEPYLNSAWTVLILRGLALFALIVGTAPLAARFFNEADATAVIRVVALSLVIQSTVNIGVIALDKELQFNKQFLYEFSGILASFIVAVILGYAWGSVWALVAALLTKNVVTVFFSYIVYPYRPRLDFHLEKAKELWGFGRWISSSRVLYFLATEGDDVVVGRLLGATTLGFYQMAYKISSAPATEIAHTISKVTLPAYSKLQDEAPRLQVAFIKTMVFTMFLSVPVAALIMTLAEDFTLVIMGQEWLPIVVPMQIIAFTGLVRSLASTTNPVFQAVNKPEIDTQWGLVRLIVLAVLIFPLTMWCGITGTSLAVLISMLVSTIAFSIMVVNITRCGPRTFIRELALPLGGGLVMVLGMLAVMAAVDSTGVWQLMLFGTIGCVIYLSAVYIGDGFLHTGLREIMADALLLLVRAVRLRLAAKL